MDDEDPFVLGQINGWFKLDTGASLSVITYIIVRPGEAVYMKAGPGLAQVGMCI